MANASCPHKPDAITHLFRENHVVEAVDDVAPKGIRDLLQHHRGNRAFHAGKEPGRAIGGVDGSRRLSEEREKKKVEKEVTKVIADRPR